MAAILSQVLSVGLMTYTGTHSSPIYQGIFGREISSFTLTGFRDGSDSEWQLCVTRQRLACFGDMIGGPAWIVHELEGMDSSTKPSPLVASLEDIADTWGRVYLEQSPGEAGFLGFRIGGGLIRPLAQEDSSYAELAKDGHIPCHWERSLPLGPASSPATTGIRFGSTDLLCIGALSENPQCGFDEADSFRNAGPFLQELAVTKSCWKQEQRTVQLSGGKFVNFAIGGTQKRIPGVSLKACIWEKWITLKDVTFLAVPWGLELSLCTGAARRVYLKDLLQSRIINFAAAMKPQEWGRIRNDFQHVFAGTTVADFRIRAQALKETDHYSDVWEVCNVALRVLYQTGSTPSGDALNVWWPFETETLSLHVVEGWARLFKDSPDQAIFAAATPNCLCLGQSITCRRPWQWDHNIHHLETAVVLDMTTASRSGPEPLTGQDWILEGKWYALGEGFLVVSRDGPNAPGFSARWRAWTRPLGFAQRVFIARYLRESYRSEARHSWEILIALK